jgi:hypothetical protein
VDSGTISQFEQLEEWLKTQDPRVHYALAARASLRSLPAAMEIVDQNSDRIGGENLLMSSLRATLASVVASAYPTQNGTALSSAVKLASSAVASATHYADSIYSAAHATASASLKATQTVPNACVSILRSAESARLVADPTALSKTCSAAFYDWQKAKSYSSASQIFEKKLWPDEYRIQELLDLWGNFCARQDLENSWSFWRDWYQRMLDGTPMDWGLQLQVALIEDTIWNAGSEAVATEIEVIKAQFLAEKVPLAESLEFDDESGTFRIIPREVTKPDLLDATLSQVEDALNDVLADPSNGLNDRSREVLVLRRSLTKYSNDPQRLEMDFTSVHTGLTRQIVVEDLPPSEANLALQRALEEGAQAVRATHSDVAENRSILNTQKIAELTEDQNTKLAKAQPLLEAISSGVMQENFREDITYLLEERFRVLVPQLGTADRNPVLAGYDEKRRTFGRLARIAIWIIKSPQILDRIDGSAGYKAATILLTIRELINFCVGLF